MSQETEERRVLPMTMIGFQPYDLEGPVQADITWQPISYDRVTQQGSYVMRMAPGAQTLPHRHAGYEDFLILEGELTDSDGRVLRQGEFISYRPGSTHHSWTEAGCVIAVFEWQPPVAETRGRTPNH
jgi:anti-sigma factor ChrR (cupin superfamily)